MKIALVSSPFFTVPPKKYGGLEAMVYNLFCGLVAMGHKVVLFAPTGSADIPGGFVYETGEPLEHVQVDWLEAEKKMWEVYNPILREEKFDIICEHDWFGFCYLSKVKNSRLKICHAHHGHMSPAWWKQSPSPFKLNLIAISNFMKDEYKSMLGYDSRVCYNGIDLSMYPYQETKGNRLLFVGRLDSFKRPHIAIEVAKKAGLGLDIVGSSFVQDPAYLESVKQACDGKKVKLYLDLPREETAKFYQNAKATIFPSKMGEPYGLIVPESCACGTPVLGSKEGAIAETIQDGVNGFLCDPDNVDEFVQAVKKVDGIDPKDCRKRAEFFSKENMAKAYVERFEEILRGDEW